MQVKKFLITNPVIVKSLYDTLSSNYDDTDSYMEFISGNNETLVNFKHSFTECLIIFVGDQVIPDLCHSNNKLIITDTVYNIKFMHDCMI